MKSEVLHSLIQRLKFLSPGGSEEERREFDQVLRKIDGLGDTSCIRPLLLLLNDDETLDEFMFSIVHTVERRDHSTYFQVLIQALPELVKQAPRWASILHKRILNSDEGRELYGDQLATAGVNENAVAREVLLRIAESRPQFASRVQEVLDKTEQ